MPSLFESISGELPDEEKPQAPKPKDRTLGEAVADTGRSLASGAAGLVKSAGDAYGLVTGDTNNAVSELGASAQEYWEAGQSDQLKAKRKERSDAIDAEDGVAGKAWQAFKSTVTDPALAVDAVASNIATLLPGAAAGRAVAGARMAKGMAAASEFGPVSMAARQALAKSAGTMGTGTAVGVGAVQQGVDVSSDVYSASMAKPNEAWAQNVDFMSALSRELETNQNVEQAVANTKHVFALKAAREAFAPAAGVSVAANMIPGGSILERSMVGGAAKQTLSGGASGVVKGIVKGGVGEAGQEAIEEGGGAYAGNMAKQRNVDPNQDLMEKVGENAGVGAAGGLLMGGPAGAFHSPAPQRPAVVEEAEKPGSVLSRAAVAGNPELQAIPKPLDPLSQRASEVESMVREGGLLDKLRGIGQPGRTVPEFLDALAIAKNTTIDPRRRQEAIDSLNMAMGWLDQGSMPNEPGTGSPFSTDLTTTQQPGTDLATTSQGAITDPGMPQAFDPNTIDGDVTRVDNMIEGPKALPAPPGMPLATIPTPPADAGVFTSAPEAQPQGNTNGPQAPEAQQATQEGQAAPASAGPVATLAAPRTRVQLPNVAIPAGPGSAVARKARAQLEPLVADGFDTVERRGNEFFLVNHKSKAEAKLDNPAAAQVARTLIKAKIDAEAHVAPSSPLNNKAEPTQGQIDAENYLKPETSLNGLKIRIENPAGSKRKGVSPDGKAWESTMVHHYGELEGVRGADGDKMDVFIGPNPDSQKVFVVDQRNQDGSFDEHKVMMGFRSIEGAKAGYLANYEPGWTGLGAITEMSVDQFKAWSKTPASFKPAAGYHVNLKSGLNDGQGNSSAAGSNQGTGSVDSADGAQRGLHDNVSSGENSALRSEAQVAADAAAVARLAQLTGDAGLTMASGTPEAAALTSLLDGVEAVFGVHGIAVKSDFSDATKSWDGVELDGTLFINVHNPEMHVAKTIGHELTHSKEKSFVSLSNRIWDLFSTAGKRAYYENYLYKGKSYDSATHQEIEKLRSEMLADFFGQRFGDRTWLNELARQKPALFGEFVRDWIKALDVLGQFLKALVGGSGQDATIKNVDRYIEQIEDAKQIAIEVASKWAENNPRMAKSSRGAQSMSYSSRIDSINELGNFNLDASFDFDLDMQEFLDAEIQKSARRELDEEQSKSRSTQSPLVSVSDAEIEANGISPEDAYPDLDWQDKEGRGQRYETRIKGLYKPGEVGVITLDASMADSNLFEATMRGTWIGPVEFENTGYATLDGAKDFARRFAAGKDLESRGFDLATTYGRDQKRMILDAWSDISAIGNPVRKSKKATSRSTSMDDIATDMGLKDMYELKYQRDILDANNTSTNIEFIDVHTGSVQQATFTVEKKDGKRYATAHTTSLSRGGMGALVYQLFAEYASKNNMVIVPDHSLSGINTYRRTEQMLSAALRTGKSNVMVPHATQRVYGFNPKAAAKEEHDDNMVRLALASLRNVRELMPEVDKLVYVPETDKFIFKNGDSAESMIQKSIGAVDARAFGLGRSTIARAVITRMAVEGQWKGGKDTSFASPILYSTRVKAQAEYESIESLYRGTDQWMRAPNGKPTELNERQWVQVRTPSFKSWFGDWEKAIADGGVWSTSEDVSKVVDANGEPLVVYHGTDHGGFMEFKQPAGTKRGDLGIFTTSNEEMAESYVRKGSAERITPMGDKEVLEGLGIFIAPYQGVTSSKDTEELMLYGYETPDGEEVSGFATEADAMRDAMNEYGGEEMAKVSGVYAMFANIRDPYESNFEGANWSGERTEQWTLDMGDGETYTDPLTGKQYFSEDEARAIAKEFAAPDDEYEGADFLKAAEDHWESTDDVAREALRNKNDGAIIREVMDDGGGRSYYAGEPSDIFVANKPNQLKSADWNSGEFGATDDLRYSQRSDIGHKRWSTGRYVGAPEWIGKSPQKLAVLRKNLRKLMQEGEPGRYWYENSSKAIMEIAGFDVAEAEKIVGLIAIYSPNNTVAGNTSMALKAYHQWKSGRDISAGTAANDEKAKDLLLHNKPWSGIKTNSFYQNLMVEIDPSKLEPGVATMDMWMALAFDYGSKALDSGPKYKFAERETQRLADEFGWSAHQVQAAIWTAIKGRIESSAAPRKEYELKHGIASMVQDVNPNTGKPSIEFVINKGHEYDHYRAATKFGMAHDLSQADIATSKYDFSDAIHERTVQMSWEAKPGKTSGVLPGIFNAPLNQQREYLDAIIAALRDESGHDMVSKGLGISTKSSVGVAGWEGVTGFGAQDTIPVAVPGGTVDASARSMVMLWSNIRGLILNQEGMAWHYPHYKGTKSEQNGIDVQLGRPLTIEEGDALYQALIRELGHAYTPPIHTDSGFRLLNFPAAKFDLMAEGLSKEERKPLLKQSDESNRQFAVAAENAIASVDSIASSYLGSRAFQSDGDLYENDWTKGDEEYRSRIRDISGKMEASAPRSWSGRSDIFEWIDVDLAPRIAAVNRDFSKRYGWGAPTRSEIKRSARIARGSGPENRLESGGSVPESERSVQEAARLKPLPGAPSVPGFHGPDPRLVAVAEQYAKKHGIDLRRQSEYVSIDADRAARIAKAYDDMPHAPNDPKVKAAYKNLIKQTIAQYRALEDAGYKFWFIDPSDANSLSYAESPWNAMRDIRSNKEMGIFPTDDGFGSSEDFDPVSNPLLEDTGIKWPKAGLNGPMQRVLANDLFRAVHDAFGHGLEGAGFRAQGEENAWQAHVRLFTGSAVAAITSETRGQNSWLNFGPHGERNQTAKTEDTIFADQKTGLMPEWTWKTGIAGDMKFSERTPLGFYSELSNKVSEASMKQAPAGAWKSYINALTQKGVKGDEIEWSGVMDWLDLQGDRKVQKGEIAEYLNSNGVQVQEVVLGIPDEGDIEALLEDELGEGMSREDAIEYLRHDEGSTPSKYDQYTLPGGENYREVLLTLPHADVNIAAEIEQKTRRLAAFREMQESELSGADKYKAKGDALEAQLVELRKLPRQMPSDNYKSSHWDAPNVLAHIRINDRTDAEGNKVLFVEEVQSDWGQQGKRDGFDAVRDKTPLTTAEISELNDLYGARITGRTPEQTARMHELNNRDNASKGKGAIPSAPFVTKTDGWLNLALKRIITMAAEGGYDKVAFANGQQNADRYSLEEQVDSIGYEPTEKGYYINVSKNGSNIKNGDFTKAELEDVVGKEIVQKMEAREGRVIGNPGAPDYEFLKDVRELKGSDLKIQATGMRAFYDKIIPNTAKTLLKKVGGGSMQKVSIPNNKEGWHITPPDQNVYGKWMVKSNDYSSKGLLFNKEEDAIAEMGRKLDSLAQPGFDITDAMREKVAGGLPLFSKRTKKEYPADALRSKYAGKKTTIQVKIEDTGEVASLTMDVNQTLDEYDKRAATMQRLLECL